MSYMIYSDKNLNVKKIKTSSFNLFFKLKVMSLIELGLSRESCICILTITIKPL